MTLVLDTSILIEIERENKEIVSRLRQLTEEISGTLYTTSPTYSEVYLGHIKKSKVNRRSVLAFLDEFVLLNTSRDSSILMSELMKKAKESGLNTPPMDLLIASIVIYNELTLVTRDKQFSQIEGLDVIIL